ncbi:MAG TPA: peptidase, partial [Nitrospirales bacterium]|nr:peptidase [Nitrospirales bacterium]
MSLFDGLEQYVRGSRPRFEEWLGRLVEIPTVSMDPSRREDVRRGAEVAVGCFAALGAQATIVET